MSPLRDLGEAVSRQQDAELARAGVADEVIQRVIERRARPRQSRPLVLGLALAAAAAVMLYFVWPRAAVPPLASPNATATELGAADQDRAFLFDDGTTILLAAGGSHARVEEAGAKGGRVELQRGRAHISVPPGKGSKWSFRTGPYTVEVTGTRFDLGWDPERQRFDLEMFDGSVHVSGAGLEPRLVVAGQRLSLGPKLAVSSAAPAPELHASASASALASSKPVASVPAATAAASAPRSSWRALALEGKHAEAVKVIEESGLDAAMASASVSDLLLLGDTCRLAGKAGCASTAYQTVRKRFAGTAEAQRALFSLGVLSFPSKGSLQSFEQYLAEAPRGPLAPEALGRILEVFDRAQDRAGARAVAQRYLASYPGGAHAALAKKILGDAPR